MSKNEKLPENIKLEMIGEKRYVRINEGAKRYSVSPNTFRMMAAEAHAIIHVRRIVLIDTTKVSLISEATNVLSNMSELQIQQCLAMMRALKNVQITD